VRISRVEYEALLADRERLRALAPGLSVPVNPGFGGVSPIDRDPELADFIRERLGRMELARIAAVCALRFGPDRAPSKSAVHRFWKRWNRPPRVVKRRLQPPSDDLQRPV